MLRNVVALVLALFFAPPQSAPYDVVIVGGRVVDGTGAAARAADIGIRGNRIDTVGLIGTADVQAAKQRIDATGLVIAPGFIDVHTHADDIASHPQAENFVQMGALIGDYGTYEDPMDFFSSPLYPFSQRLEGMKGWFFRRYIPEINQRIDAIRKEAV